MAQYKVIILVEGELSTLGSNVANFFGADIERDIDQMGARLRSVDYKIIVFDTCSSAEFNLPSVSQLLKMEETLNLPVVILTASGRLGDKLKAFELGCDDFIHSDTSGDETCARVTKSIFHRVASDQLASRLELANQTARTAMVDNSDLGANIQFLISVHDCDNLDQLGQLFFRTTERYGLKCSLQMRSEREIKNMEAHGMAKDLESQLLSQLKDSDRYIDFGTRTIVNYDRVSLLVKNMPVDEPEKYGAIKDNTFCLLQGINARVISLEDRFRIIEEGESLKKLSSHVGQVMNTIKDSYQRVMRDIADEVDKANELVQMKIPSLALTEQDEAYIENTLENCVRGTTRIFNEGLVVDQVFQRLEEALERAIDTVDDTGHDSQLGGFGGKATDAGVELFG
ncbi:MAG: CheY-like chemotaxis protein [Flavobacteriales bacterium]|jgi:CheY-like chemotaxis protein